MTSREVKDLSLALIGVQSTRFGSKDTLRLAMDGFSAPVLRDIAQAAVRLAYLADIEAEIKERMAIDTASGSGAS